MADATLLGHFDPAASRMVEELFRSAASRVRTRLVNRLGTDLPVGPVSLEWAQLAQVLQQLPAGSAVATFRIDPSQLTGLVAIEPELLARLVGQILGQSPDHAYASTQERAPSRFDLVVARRITEDVLGGIAEVLPDSVGTTVEIVRGSPEYRCPSRLNPIATSSIPEQLFEELRQSGGMSPVVGSVHARFIWR